MLLTLLAALLAQSHWPLDGDGKGVSGDLQAVGRMTWIDSPVRGRCAVFNGVDAFFSGSTALGRESTISLWALTIDPKGGPLLSTGGWTLQFAEEGRVRFQGPGGTLQSAAGAWAPNQWMHLGVALRGGAPALLAINGQSAATGTLDAGSGEAAPLLLGKSAEGKLFAGLIDELRIHPKASGLEEIAAWTDQGMPWLRPKARGPFAGTFELAGDDVVVFTGGENARAGGELAYLETLLSLQAGGKRVRFRSMAWEGDTVYEQIRPLRFGGWTEQFRRVGASVIFAQFGQTEALAGGAALDGFIAAYERLLSEFEKTTPRIVLLSPSPFARAAPNQPDLTARNGELRRYVEAIRALAARKGYLFVDLSTPPLAADGVMRNGLHYTPTGQWLAARETARQLQLPGISDVDAPGESGAFRRDTLEELRASLLVKNGLWNDSWRPSNWAFLNGDRTEQPSGRDHQDKRLRWFAVEVQEYPALLRRQEDVIDGRLRALEKK